MGSFPVFGDTAATCPKTAAQQHAELASAARKIESFAAELAGRHPRQYLQEIEKDEVVKSFWPGVKKDKLSGVQVIACGDTALTALVVCDSKTIITAAHGIYNQGKLRWAEDSPDQNKDCFLLVEDKDGTKYAYDFKFSETKVGSTTPTAGGHNSRDWAILKLQDPIPANMVTPLKVTKFDSPQKLLKQPMVYAAGYFLDMGVEKRAYTACSPNHVHTVRDRPLLESPCSNDGGGSGGGMLTVVDDQPTVSAVHVGKTTISGNSVAIPIAGEFKQTLFQMSDSQNCEAPFPSEGSKHAALR